MNFAHFCEFWCFSLGKQARFTSNFCSGMPLRKVHELTFLWFGLPGRLLTFNARITLTFPRLVLPRKVIFALQGKSKKITRKDSWGQRGFQTTSKYLFDKIRWYSRGYGNTAKLTWRHPPNSPQKWLHWENQEFHSKGPKPQNHVSQAIVWKRRKGPHPHTLHFTKKTARFTKGRFRPYEGPKMALRRAILW